MNRRAFIKYLSVAPIALATLLTSPKAASVVREKEESEELDAKTGKWFDFSPLSETERQNYRKARNLKELGQEEELGCELTAQGVCTKNSAVYYPTWDVWNKAMLKNYPKYI